MPPTWHKSAPGSGLEVILLLMLCSSMQSGEEVDSSSLIQHFFGQRGKAVIRFEDFFNFMDNLQREVLELEFLNHSQGNRTDWFRVFASESSNPWPFLFMFYYSTLSEARVAPM